MATDPIPLPEPPPKTLLQSLQEELAAAEAALLKVTRAQSYQVGDGATARAWQGADYKRLTERVDRLRARIAALTPGRRRVLYMR